MKYKIRQVSSCDIDGVSAIERLCFPSSEAADQKTFALCIQTFPESFFVAENEQGQLIGFINGCVTDKTTICDSMFEDCSYHKKDGSYQAVFGLDVIPQYRHQGVASSLMNSFIRYAVNQKKKGLILTCKEHLITYYETFGYRKKGISASVHGGAVWYDMVLELHEE